jgi:hypothetical protein
MKLNAPCKAVDYQMTHMLQRRATRYFLILFLLCNSFINIGCTTEQTRESYRPEEVQTRIVSDDIAKKIYVIFRTNMESQFYSLASEQAQMEKTV